MSEAMRHHDEELGWMLARFQASGGALRDIIQSVGGDAQAIKAEVRA
jgi:hypothetical protein